MSWQIEYSKQFKKSLDKLDKPIIRQILKFIEKLKTYDNPLILGKLLVGEKIGGFSRFIAGTYRQHYKYKSFLPNPINKKWVWDSGELNIIYCS